MRCKEKDAETNLELLVLCLVGLIELHLPIVVRELILEVGIGVTLPSLQSSEARESKQGSDTCDLYAFVFAGRV